MSKTYILQKDFGLVKKGEEIKWNPGYEQYMSWKWENNHSECLFFTQADIDRNPDWFKEVAPFEWTDDLVLEFARFTNQLSPVGHGRYTDLENFKQSNTSKAFAFKDGKLTVPKEDAHFFEHSPDNADKPDWEISAVKSNDGQIVGGLTLLSNDRYMKGRIEQWKLTKSEIHSVKRLSGS